MDGRSRTLISFLVAAAVAAIALTAVVVARPTAGSCAEWQERYRASVESGGPPTGTLQFINVGPMSELDAERPEGCDVPEGP